MNEPIPKNLSALNIIFSLLLFPSDASLSVTIRELRVPELVELGTNNHIELDCDYDYEDREKLQLDIKWYFNNEPSPFYQWVPGEMDKPQIIGEKFKGHLNLGHAVHRDHFKRHRALMIVNPTLELSGIYTCKVSTFLDEEIRQKRMTIYCKQQKKFEFPFKIT